ncbi:hypothetical protein T09_4919 [Trichinella sp. T9]|nr:hypothetical protein T09_4919 [Trichinella sp. T9]
MSMIQELFRQILDPSPMQRALLEQVPSRWENLWETPKMHAESIKAVEAVLTGIVEANEILNAHERTLCLYDYMPSNLAQLRNMHAELLSVQMLLQQQQAVFDDLSSNVGKLRQHVARTRFNVADRHIKTNACETTTSPSAIRLRFCLRFQCALLLYMLSANSNVQQMKCHFDKHSWKGYSILTFHWSKYFLEIATSTFLLSFIFSLVLTFNNCIYANVVCFSG